MEPGWDLRRDIDVSDCQKDQVFEGVETAEPTCPILDNFDDAIEAFRDGVGQTRPDEGEDVLGVGAKHPDEFLDRFKAASHCRRRPALISGYGFSSVLLWMRQLETAQDSTSERTYAP